MTREIRSRRAGIPRELARQRPLYARIIGLQYLTPSGFLCFVFFEGAVALGILLALAELVSWWGVLVLPLTVAAMVKLNDVIAGAVSRPAVVPAGAPTAVRQRAGGTGTPARRVPVRPATMELSTPPPAVAEPTGDVTAVVPPALTRSWPVRAEELDATQQRVRQTASRRYE